jgi:large subunit ribosomal protein L22
MSPRKVRLVADLIRGHRVERAITMLSVLNKVAAEPVLKLLKSALANATHNFSLPAGQLIVGRITVDGGPSLKRWMPKAHGRATPVREPTSHITIVLTSLEAKKNVTKNADQKAVTEKVIDATEVQEAKPVKKARTTKKKPATKE